MLVISDDAEAESPEDTRKREYGCRESMYSIGHTSRVYRTVFEVALTTIGETKHSTRHAVHKAVLLGQMPFHDNYINGRVHAVLRNSDEISSTKV